MSRVSARRAAFWLGLAVTLCYLGSLNGSFHFDDSHSVQGNLALRSLSHLPSFWTDPATSSFIPENRVYRPLTHSVFALCWWFGAGATWPFHAAKMAMHFGVALALFSVWRRLWSESGWFPVHDLSLRFPWSQRGFAVDPSGAALLLALIFSVHPAGSECVDYISATTSLQCALFYVWAFRLYLAWRDSGSARALLGALLLYSCSVASKEEGITLPAMVVSAELMLASGEPLLSSAARFRRAFRRALPFIGTGVLLAVWIYAMHPESGNESRGSVTWSSYFLTQWRAYLWYMRLWFWPWGLNADYATVEFSQSLFEPLVIQAALGNLLVVALGWFNRRRLPALWFGIVWFYVTISPASSVVRLAEAINEHRMYLAYVGFVGGAFALLLLAAEKCLSPERRPSRLGWAFVAILLALAAGTQERNRVWTDDEALWTDTVEKNPGSGRALNNLALVYLGRGEYERSIALLERCEASWAGYSYCPLNRGLALRALGAKEASRGRGGEAQDYFSKAEAALVRAHQLNPRNVHANFHLAAFYDEIRGECGKSLAYYRVAIDVTGGRHPEAERRFAACSARLRQQHPGQAQAQGTR